MRALELKNASSELLRYRHLLLSLTWRDIRVRCKQSFLRIAWAVLFPLSMMLVFTFVFTRAIDARSVLHVDMPCALYAYTGLAPWACFSVSLGGCMQSLVANRNLAAKVYFPPWREGRLMSGWSPSGPEPYSHVTLTHMVASLWDRVAAGANADCGLPTCGSKSAVADGLEVCV